MGNKNYKIEIQKANSLSEVLMIVKRCMDNHVRTCDDSILLREVINGNSKNNKEALSNIKRILEKEEGLRDLLEWLIEFRDNNMLILAFLVAERMIKILYINENQ